MLSSSHSLQAHVEYRSAVLVGSFYVPFILLCLPANTPDILTTRQAGRRMTQEVSQEGGCGQVGGDGKLMMGSTVGGFLWKVISANLLEAQSSPFPWHRLQQEKKKKSAGGKTYSEEGKKKWEEQEITFIDFALSSLPIVSLGEERLQCHFGLQS